MRKTKLLLCILLSLCVAFNTGFALSLANTDFEATGASEYSSEVNSAVFDTSGISITPGAEKVYDDAFLTQYPTSLLWNPASLQYYYEGANYAYGIDADGKEIIALKKGNGAKIDLLEGAGKFKIYDSRSSWYREIMVTNTAVASFTEDNENGTDCLTVQYSVDGNYSDGATITAKYLFCETCISVSFHITAQATEDFCLANSYLERTYINGYQNEYVKINSKWIYPDTLDYPYQEFECLAFIDEIDSAHRLYSFLREDEMPTYCMAENMNGTKLPIYFDAENGGLLDYTYSYTLAMADASTDKQSADYLGLFRGKNCDFAAGIAPVVANDDNSTVFIGNSVKLNLNVTNLKSSDLTFSLRYDVRDYYGNVVDKGLFVDNKILKGLDANREIEITGKYGMYYLNLYVISENDTYTECYPFALLEEYSYKYNDTSPFGVSSFNGYKPKNNSITDYSQYADMAKLSAKVGVANARINSSEAMLYYAKRMNELGITQFNGQYGGTNTDPASVDGYVSNVSASLAALAPYVQSYEVGNEYNLKLLSAQSGQGEDKEADNTAAYNLYYNYTFLPTYNYIMENYPDIAYIPTSVSAAASGWLNQLAIEQNKIWDKFDIFSVHTYAACLMPDSFAKNPDNINGSDLWNIEDAMYRARTAINQYGEKKLYVTEVGYNTAPLSYSSVDLRTQADYTVRIGAICLAYGADRIQYYCFGDRTSYFTGFNNTNAEFNFGLFYEADYYGIVKPKPSAIAFAVMTRNLESAYPDEAYIADEYDQGNTVNGVRAFRVKTALGGDVIVAYSNSEVLSNGKKLVTGATGRRTPNLPWNCQWTKTDLTTFNAVSDTVTVVDIMGNRTEYMAEDGKVSIPLTGSPVYIYGAE